LPLSEDARIKTILPWLPILKQIPFSIYWFRNIETFFLFLNYKIFFRLSLPPAPLLLGLFLTVVHSSLSCCVFEFGESAAGDS
jgi:hypothetical protein